MELKSNSCPVTRPGEGSADGYGGHSWEVGALPLPPVTGPGLERLAPRRLRLCKVWAQRTAKESRHRDLFIPSGARPRPGKHVQSYKTPQTRTVAHYNSAVPYLTRLLNGF